MLFNLCLIPHSALACQCAQVLYPDIALPPLPWRAGFHPQFYTTCLVNTTSTAYYTTLLPWIYHPSKVRQNSCAFLWMTKVLSYEHFQSSVEWKLERASEGMLGWECNCYYCSIQLCVFCQLSGSWRGPLRECWGGSVTVITVVYSSVFFCQLSGSWRGPLRECWGGIV